MSATVSAPRARKGKRPGRARKRSRFPVKAAGILTAWSLAVFAAAGWWFQSSYTVSFQWPFRVHAQSPIVISERLLSDGAEQARADQNGWRLSAWQQYACRKFGADCRVALAIQRAENSPGKCEVYHYNSNGTLDWGYFQINTVHLERPGLNLRDLLDCKANIDFAYQLYVEKGGFSPWSTYKSGAYRRYMRP
ncbi:MAG: hypothetical protein LC126_14245 [Bryobacterales bacterium]|nr:hypothetical protein [Bryobacterales bacterium]